jgi:hypothetical protein
LNQASNKGFEPDAPAGDFVFSLAAASRSTARRSLFPPFGPGQKKSERDADMIKAHVAPGTGAQGYEILEIFRGKGVQ